MTVEKSPHALKTDLYSRQHHICELKSNKHEKFQRIRRRITIGLVAKQVWWYPKGNKIQSQNFGAVKIPLKRMIIDCVARHQKKISITTLRDSKPAHWSLLLNVHSSNLPPLPICPTISQNLFYPAHTFSMHVIGLDPWCRDIRISSMCMPTYLLACFTRVHSCVIHTQRSVRVRVCACVCASV